MWDKILRNKEDSKKSEPKASERSNESQNRPENPSRQPTVGTSPEIRGPLPEHV